MAADKIRLIQLVLSLDPGGAERLVIELTRHLEPKIQATVCCLDGKGEWADELEDQGVPVIALERRPGFRPGLARRIAALARHHQASVIHCHQYSPFVYGGLSALVGRGLRVVYTEHGRFSDRPASLKRSIANRALVGHLPGRLFAVSEDLRRQMIADGLPGRRLGVIYNGIEPGPRRRGRDRADARLQLDLPAEGTVIGTVARLDPVKDLVTLVASLRQVTSHGEGLPTLVVVGDGPERQRLERQASEQGVRDRVRFTGMRHDVRRILPALDLYANSSIMEGLSVTLLEAMAAGLPVVATAVGGNPELVIDGETGVLVPARDPGALAGAINRVLATPATGRKMGDAGRERLERNFSLEAMANRYLRVYRGLDPENEG